jgi:biotin carboxylase
MVSRRSIGFVEVSLAASSPNSPSAGVDGLRAARRLGYETIVLSADPDFYGPLVRGLVDEFVACDSQDPDAVVDAVAGRRPAAILTFSDLFVSPAAGAARALGLRGPTPGSPALARDKALVRRVLADAGIRNPAWHVAEIDGETPALPLDYPLVVKPVDGSASEDVRRVENTQELELAVAAHRSRSTYGRGVAPKHVLLFEEELEGPMWSIEGFSRDGGPAIWGYTDRILGDPPFYVERSCTFSAERPHPEIDGFVRRVLEATGYDFGPFHLEVIVTDEGPQVVELNPRLLGAGVHDCVSLTCGADVVEEVLKCYLGESRGDLPPPRGAGSLRLLYPERAGTVVRVEGADEAQSLPGVKLVDLRVREGDRVNDPRENGDSFGHVIAVGETREEAVSRAAAAEERIRLQVEA